MQYFLYFGVLGAYLPFFNLYCLHIGLSGIQIGTLSAVRSAALVLFALLWGLLADRYAARRPIYIACNLLATGVWVFYLASERFVPMLAITVLHGVFFAPLIPFLEAFSMDVLGSEKKRYGRIRAWGSVSFIAMVVLLGRAIDAWGLRLVLAVVLAGSALQAAFAWGVPPAARARQAVPGSPGSFLLNRRSLIFFSSTFLMLVSHGADYGFFSIHLESLGCGNAFIGVSWAAASAAEIGVMLASGRLFARFAPQTVLHFSFLAAALRWTMLFFTVSPAAILATQLLHAVTYGAFHMASILFVDELAPEASKTIGQAINNGVTYGLGLMVGFFLNGYLYERVGTAALFPISAAVSLAGGALFTLLRPARRAAPSEPPPGPKTGPR